jgi:hypothetical protein
MTTAPLPFAYEFRFFAPSLAMELERLSMFGVAAEPLDASETYIVSRLTIDASVKIVKDRLQVKELTERVGILEGWSRAVDVELPITGELFVVEAGARLGAHLEVGKEALLYEEDIEELARDYHGLKPARVAKRRTVFDLDECRGEYTSVSVGDVLADTIAIEGWDPRIVLEKIERMGFLARINESYPCFLQRVVFYDEHQHVTGHPG